MILTGANTHSGGTRVEAGELVIQNTAALGSGGLDVQAGAKVFVDVGYGRVAVSQVSLASTARIDLGRGGLSIAAGGGTVSSVRQLLVSARNSGLWDGYGIGSTNAKSTSNTAIGYRQQTPTSPIIVAWAAFGDINLDGRVNSSDVSALNSAKRYGLPSTFTGAHWYEGDFSYDGRVNSTDINFLNRWFNKGFYNTVIYAAAFSVTTSSTSSTSKTSTLFVSPL
jgi:autotransporter-associated beta strand protein